MTMRFRNLDLDGTEPVDRWPAEAIEIVMDRGSLSDWRQLAEAIWRNPWGPAARTAETVAAWGEHYGVDELMSSVIRHARENLTLAGRAEYAAQIRSWRAQCGMTLRQFARAAGTSASRLSDYENAKVAPTTDVLGRLSHVAGTHARLSGAAGLLGDGVLHLPAIIREHPRVRSTRGPRPGPVAGGRVEPENKSPSQARA
jgi:DNA-binding transcriptional regulator YiaG